MFKLLVGLAAVGVVLGLSKGPPLGGRIVGGNDTTISKYPYQLALLSLNTYFCGGVIITYHWGLTAAHCFDFGVPFNLQIRGGSTRRSTGGQIVEVDEVLRHPNYHVDTHNYDAALMHFAEPFVIFNTEPVKMPPLNFPIYEGERAIVTGWGAQFDGGANVDILQETYVPVITLQRCRLAYGPETITEAMFCAGYLGESVSDVCQGDAGGPVTIDGVLIGLVSWGYGCADPDYPAVYTRVPIISGWVEEILARP